MEGTDSVYGMPYLPVCELPAPAKASAQWRYASAMGYGQAQSTCLAAICYGHVTGQKSVNGKL